MPPTALVTVPFRAQRLVAVFPPGSAERRLFEAALGREGLRPLVAIETSQREAILPLVTGDAGRGPP